MDLKVKGLAVISQLGRWAQPSTTEDTKRVIRGTDDMRLSPDLLKILLA
jgi:hypothetical protein